MISDEKFQQLCDRMEETSKGVAEVKAILTVSTPDHGCIIDTVRQQGQQIKDLYNDRWLSIIAKTSLVSIVKYGWGILFLLLAKGFLVSVASEALKLAAK